MLLQSNDERGLFSRVTNARAPISVDVQCGYPLYNAVYWQHLFWRRASERGPMQIDRRVKLFFQVSASPMMIFGSVLTKLVYCVGWLLKVAGWRRFTCLSLFIWLAHDRLQTMAIRRIYSSTSCYTIKLNYVEHQQQHPPLHYAISTSRQQWGTNEIQLEWQ